MQVQAEINEMDVLKQIMIQYSYEVFARMIAVTVSQADDPQELASRIAYKMRCI